ncbi:MAG: cysteine desulfurase [Ruminococcaceae bacterium]|nr:cysteine desulfurase [Oscillospiraceae bacterium]
MVYLDNASTTKPCKQAIEAAMGAMENFGNPSSMHKLGIVAEKIIDEAKISISKVLGVDKKTIYFTSGGTESNNTAILGYAFANRKRGNHLITSKIEHPSVLECFKLLEKEGFTVTYINVDKYGVVDLEELSDAIREDTLLVSIMAVNNETGTVQPIEKIKKIIREKSNLCVYHSDCVQGFCKIDINPKKMGIDMLSISGHKINAPKGIGALYISEGIHVAPWLIGGGQQKNMRSGTENVPGIAALGAACGSYERISQEIFENFKNKLTKKIDNVKINSTGDNSGYILNVSFIGIKAEILLHSLEAKGIYVSTGSACSTNKPMPSHVLSAMGCSDEEIKGAVRFSFGSDEFDIDTVTDIIKNEVENIRKYVR